jgi:surface antigen
MKVKVLIISLLSIAAVTMSNSKLTARRVIDTDLMATCVNKSPVGYCTAGVRLDKGGALSNDQKYVCDGVDWSGDAKTWYANAQAAGKTVGSTAKVGAIVVFPGNKVSSQGHVGVITRIDAKDGAVMKSMNDVDGFGKWTTRPVKNYPNSKNVVAPTGYIY